MPKTQPSLALKYKSFKTDELIDIVTKNFRDYTPEAIKSAKNELLLRGYGDIEIPENLIQDTAKDKLKPSTKWALRIVLYIIWPIIWVLIFGVYIRVTMDLRYGVLNFLTNTVQITDIVTVAKIEGIFFSAIDILLYALLVVGFVAITNDTKVRKSEI